MQLVKVFSFFLLLVKLFCSLTSSSLSLSLSREREERETGEIGNKNKTKLID